MNAAELTYTVRGADSKEYGPVTTEQVDKWIRERRLQPKQEVRRSDMDYWAPAGDFTELAPMFAAVAPAAAAGQVGGTAPQAQAAVNPVAIGRMKTAASWLYWVAGLSLVNSISAATGSGWRFILGLGITQELDGRFDNMVALALSFVVAGIFVMLGVFAHKGQTWAFISGLVLFALDGLILLDPIRPIGIAFHAYVLFRLVQGLLACRELKR